MKIKKFLTVFMAGVMAFVTTTCGEIGNKIAENPLAKPVKAQWDQICAVVAIKNENTLLALKNLLLNSNFAWGVEQRERLKLENKMMPALSKSQEISRQSGILLDANRVALETILNGRAYRGSG